MSLSGDSFLGQGWSFPLRPDAQGRLGYVSGDDNVHQSVRLLLLTRLGERVMRPDYGTAVPRLLFAPGSVQNLGLIESSIRSAVRDWEPRIDLDEVRAEQDLAAPERVTVSIAYRIRATNTRGNLVFPFYLGQGGVAS